MVEAVVVVTEAVEPLTGITLLVEAVVVDGAVVVLVVVVAGPPVNLKNTLTQSRRPVTK